jgi:serine/threonine-protein kinase HipA
VSPSEAASGPDPAAARSVEVADVWKGDRLSARLRRTDVGVEFAYTSDYLSDPGPAVATTLAVSDIPVLTSAGAVPAFFAGLLPEGRRLSSLRRAVKTSADDDLSLLLAVGADPVGDVKVLPTGEAPTERRPLVQVDRSWDEVRFSEILADAGVRDPFAIPGVQDKASARMLAVPVAAAGHRYILKIDPPEYPHVVENENYFLRLARSAGFPVVSAEIVRDAAGRSGLLITRFDRVIDPSTGTVVARPVEDAAQLLGRYPKDKYRVTSEQVAAAIADVCASRPLALREVFRQVAFAWLTGNGDLHAKNVSVVGTDGEWRVAPSYDVPSTAAYGDRTMALRVGGRVDGLSRRSLLAFAEAIGLPDRAATKVLHGVLAATADVDADWRHGGASPFGPEQTQDMLRVLRHRRRSAEAET